MKKLRIFIPVLLLFFALQSCNDNVSAIQETQVTTVTDLVLATPALSSFDAALQRVDLREMLRSQGPFTVLAPNNEAFTEFLAKKNFSTVQDVPEDLLREIVLNHVIRRSLKSTDLSTGYEKTMAISEASKTEMSLHVNTKDRIRFNGVAYVSQADMLADNGVMHIVDRVIELPRVVDFALVDPNFSMFKEALNRGDLTFDFMTVLSIPHGTDIAPFTVFAPTNEAFESVLAELKLTMISEIPEPTLKSILNYHVISRENVVDSMLSDDMYLETIGGIIEANVTGGATLTDPNNRVVDIIATNVQGNNGVMHTINKVLLPK